MINVPRLRCRKHHASEPGGHIDLDLNKAIAKDVDAHKLFGHVLVVT